MHVSDPYKGGLMPHDTHKGNALLITIIIVAAVVIVGGLGFVFWRQLTQAPSASGVISSFDECKKQSGSRVLETYPEQCVTQDGQTFTGPLSSDVVGTELLTYCASGEKLCFDYPKDWTVEQLDPVSAEVGFQGDRFVVYDPTDSMKLWFTSGIGGIGGTCDPDGTTTTVLQGTPISQLSGFKTEYEKSVDQPSVARVITRENDMFRANLYVSNDESFINKGQITEVSGVCFSQILSGRHARMSSEYDGYGSFTFNNGGTFSDFNSYSLYDTLKDATAAFDTKLFVEGANILASLRYS